MDYILGAVLVAIVLFLIQCAILRFVIGTDRIMYYQRQQIRLLRKLLEHYDVALDPDEEEEEETRKQSAMNERRLKLRKQYYGEKSDT